MLTTVVLVIVLGIAARQDDAAKPEGAGIAQPRGVVHTYAVPRGRPSAPVLITIFEDFQCPACRVVESYLRGAIREHLRGGVVRVEYRPMAFLDDASTTAYSSRALGAAACVLDEAGATSYARMHDQLYARQPAEGTAGLEDETLADMAALAGADRAAVSSCMQAQRFAGWVRGATDQALADGVTATPTILVNGRRLQFVPDESPIVTFRRAVREAS